MSDEAGQQKPIKNKPGNPKIKDLGKPYHFKKGEKPPVGVGRPKKLPSLDLALQRMLEEKKDGLTGLEAMLKGVRNKVIRTGDARGLMVILERAYGKVKQDIDITTQGESLNKDKTAIVKLPDGTTLEL